MILHYLLITQQDYRLYIQDYRLYILQFTQNFKPKKPLIDGVKGHQAEALIESG